MSHYEERLEHDLAEIRNRVRIIGSDVRDAVATSVRALLSQDDALASATILGDGAINRATRECDRMSHAFVVRHLPQARHLRFVSSVLRINVALERVGDYARTVARETVALSEPAPESIRADVEILCDKSIRMFERAVRAFVEADLELARETIRLDDEVEETFQRVFDDLLTAGDRHHRPMKDLFAFLTILNALERVSDQAKNVCEETVFTVAGETKDPKVYRILFMDRHGSVKAPMAASYARKAYPNSGHYDTGSWLPANEIEPRVMDFLDSKGAPPEDPTPRLFEADRDALSGYHVVVGLDEGAREQIEELPYHTVFVLWDLGPDNTANEDGLTAMYRSVAEEVSRLMQALRGSDAD